MEKICCRCKRNEQAGRWVALKDADTSTYSYGFCPNCYQETLAEIKMASPKYRSRKTPEMTV
ncbi:MAG: hypothetical protein KKC76_18060 [Proteobacteria bacterium]|nr:hypothetical protein [Pseudomonadota bacterium]MBU4294950.1 hypothetical protein [Pseudomonadota bacterium]MCG2747958.1 hypothetical protein [Desulfobulbaceae bacterium]